MSVSLKLMYEIAEEEPDPRIAGARFKVELPTVEIAVGFCHWQRKNMDSTIDLTVSYCMFLVGHNHPERYYRLTEKELLHDDT